MSYGDNLVGTVLDGRYQLVERIGEGGMGVVYKAQQLSSGQIVAVKVLNPHMAKDPTWVQRFYNEAKATSQLQHPNTIKMHEFGQTPTGVLYLSMEFLDGQSLREAIQTSAPMQPARVLTILSQCCDSLAEAHSHSIIHRDIKPDNIFLLPRPRPDFVKLLDFSVAKLLADHGFRTQAGMVFGTPEYMSPEQGRGRQLDARSDLYALGTVAFEMLTGQVPFADPHNPMAILQAHMTSPVPPLPQHVPPQVSQLINRCMAKEPGQRYGSADEMKAHCDAALGQLGVNPPPSMRAAAPSQATPNPARAAAAGGSKPGFGVAAAQRTMIASGQPSGRPPAAAKTIMAGDAAALMAQAGGPPPPAGGPPPPVGGPPPPVGGPPPAVHAGPSDRTAKPGALGAPAQMAPPPAANKPSNAVAKTMIAGNVEDLYGDAGPPALGGQPPAMPQGGPPAMPQGGPPQPAGPAHGPNKTMMLNPSEGVVSFNMANTPLPAPPVAPPPPAVQGGGASAGFWILCLTVGAGVGAGAYFIFLAVAGGG